MADKAEKKAAAKGAAGDIPASFDAAKHYIVILSEVVKHAGQSLRPGNPLVLRGDIAQKYRSSIASVEGEVGD